MEEQNKPAEQRERLDAWYPASFYLNSRLCGWTISAETARQVEAALDAVPPPNWVSFVDIHGARVRVRTRDIRYLQQSTPETRELWRRVRKERDEEFDDDPPWDRDL